MFRKNIIIGLILSSLLVPGFSKDLSGNDLLLVTKTLDSKLFVDDYETYEEKIAYINKIEKDLIPISLEASEEAKIISENMIILQKLKLKATEEARIEAEQPSKKKDKSKEKDTETEKIINACNEKYANYMKNHSDVSAYFKYHYKEIEMASFTYLPKTQQLKAFSGVMDGYKEIEKEFPTYSENLMTVGIALYFLPGIMGGNKKEGKEKLLSAINYAQCDYERVNSYIMLSQILYEEKDLTGCNEYLNKAAKIVPNSQTLKHVREMNQAGFSMLEEEKYKKAQKKK